DSAQSGYQENHNLDPNVISGGAFGQLWQLKTNSTISGQPEQFYAKPLVYTPSSSSRQLVMAFSEQNKIYAVDAINGTLYAMRDLGSEGEVPFQASDLNGCNDISGTIGITGTPVIDSTTDTVYFWAKGYQPGKTGYMSSVYRFHAVDAFTLKERPGFPTNIEGLTADNDNTRYFAGGTHLQRTSLNLINGVVYAGFGGHCDMFNYTGWVVGIRASTGAFVTAYATSAGPGSPAQGLKAGCGVWMSGSMLASDKPSRLFFSTGNGYSAWVNDASPASGRTQLSTLSEAIVNLGIHSNGTLYQADYFEPAAYRAMDNADRDLGSGGVALLPFSGGGVSTTAVTCGKNGQCFIMNADNLGGYMMGRSNSDAILQTITPPAGAAIFGTVGSYPLEGGYIYVAPVGSPIYAYALGYDSNGRPTFTLAATSSVSTTGRVAISAAVVTSNQGLPGSGILWVVDPDVGLLAFQAVPVNGQLVQIQLPPAPQLSKFQRPAFGDGRFYTTGPNVVLGYGAPVALPFNCTSPLQFGNVQIGNSVTLTVTCKALIPTAITGMTLGGNLYNSSMASLALKNLAAGQSVSFPVTFNLAGYLPGNGAGGKTLTPGVKSGSITLQTTNGIPGYSSMQPISLTGQAISLGPIPAVNPLQVVFSPIIVGSATASQGSSSTLILQNLGQSPLTILGYAYTVSNPIEEPNFTNLTRTNTSYVLDADGYFSAPTLPAINSTLAATSSVTLEVDFDCQILGNHFTFFVIFTDGGMIYAMLTGAADSAPVARFSYSSSGIDWTPIPTSLDLTQDWPFQIDLGTYSDPTVVTMTIMVQNTGGSDLIITKSKPPEGGVISAASPETDLHEGLTIQPGKNATAVIQFYPVVSPELNDPAISYTGVWTLNVNDLTWGVHVLNFTGALQAPQVGPVLANGSPRFKYLGCFHDGIGAARIEPASTTSSNNSNGFCQQYALTNKAAFGATEYMSECWIGRNIPSAELQVADSLCQNYICSGSSIETCGGVGSYAKMWYDVTAYFPQNRSLAAAYRPPSWRATVGSYVYAGCIYDNGSARSLSKAMASSNGLTLEDCAAACSGYKYFGTEYSAECYCGNSVASTGVYETDSDCNMLCGGDVTEFCGGASRLSLYALNGTSANLTVSATTSATEKATGASTSSAEISTATGSAVTVASVGDYFYYGCYSDNIANRTLQSKSTSSASVSVEFCASYCSDYQYFGVEWSRECYCGSSLLASSTVATDGRCSMACVANAGEICGGSSGLSIYLRNSSASSPSSSSSSPTASTASTTSAVAPASLGCPDSNATTYNASNGQVFLLECYIDHEGGDLSMVPVSSYAACCEACANTATCIAFSWLPGTNNPCYMKNIIGTGLRNTGVWGAVLVSTFAAASTTSTTSSTLLTSSSPVTSGFTSTSAYTTSSSTLSVTPSTFSSSASTSNSIARSSMGSQTSASTETSASGLLSTGNAGILTLTDSSISTSGSASASGTASASSEWPTGGTSNPAFASSPRSASSSSMSSSAPTSSSTSTVGSVATQVNTASSTTSSVGPSSIPDWQYYGCANDSTSRRALAGTSAYTNNAMTIEICQAYCASKRLPLAGLEYSTQCYCGINLASGYAIGQTGCNMGCGGNKSEICGGSSRLSVYLNTTFPNPVVVASASGQQLLGCYADSTASRTLKYYRTSSPTDMTVEVCVAACQTQGYSVAGVEYGQECYCDNAIPSDSLLAPNSDCMGMLCSGNSTEYCAAAGRILVYV
ncbi:WSC-domain-containing protein, partial [Thozetella sp. PMI_491]